MTVVTVEQGSLRGKEIELVTGKKAVAFKGIPYAKPPIGDLRFRAPVPIDKWEGVRDALEHGNVCIQKDFITDAAVGDEDCLYLNVYTPGPPGNKHKPYPVMVFIHGGAFKSGSGNSDMYGPDYLVSSDVVLVTLNYRVEAFGFLCLDTSEVPGNAGLKDQLLAMKWVKDNIESFGGDSNNITIFGESAGSASVSFHYVSPASRGYFHKAIAQSGTCNDGWAIQSQPLEVAQQICRHLGKDTTDKNEILTFLRTIEPTKLANIGDVVVLDEHRPGIKLPFVPVVEKDFCDPTQFLIEPVSELIKRKAFSKVPLLLGYTSSEGIMTAPDTLEHMEKFINSPKHFTPTKIRRMVKSDEAETIGSQIRQFYFGEKIPTKEDIDDIVKYESDFLFNYSVQKFADLIAERSPAQVFFYKFNCESELNGLKYFFKCPEAKGVSHGEDLFYLFKVSIFPQIENIDLNSRSGKMILQVSELWTNFASEGNPTPEGRNGVTWKPYAADKYYLEIDEQLSLHQNPDGERFEFWDELYNQVGLSTMRIYADTYIDFSSKRCNL